LQALKKEKRGIGGVAEFKEGNKAAGKKLEGEKSRLDK